MAKVVKVVKGAKGSKVVKAAMAKIISSDDVLIIAPDFPHEIVGKEAKIVIHEVKGKDVMCGFVAEIDCGAALAGENSLMFNINLPIKVWETLEDMRGMKQGNAYYREYTERLKAAVAEFAKDDKVGVKVGDSKRIGFSDMDILLPGFDIPLDDEVYARVVEIKGDKLTCSFSSNTGCTSNYDTLRHHSEILVHIEDLTLEVWNALKNECDVEDSKREQYEKQLEKAVAKALKMELKRRN